MKLDITGKPSVKHSWVIVIKHSGASLPQSDPLCVIIGSSLSLNSSEPIRELLCHQHIAHTVRVELREQRSP